VATASSPPSWHHSSPALGDAFKAKSGYELAVVEKGANKLGDDNWELVAVGQYGNYTHQYVFKRPKIAK